MTQALGDVHHDGRGLVYQTLPASRRPAQPPLAYHLLDHSYEKQRIAVGALVEGTHLVSASTFDWRFGFSRGERHTPKRNDWEFRSGASAFPNTYDVADPAHPIIPMLDQAGFTRTGREIPIQSPLSEETVRSLKVGDVVLVSGRMFTGRDAVTRFLSARSFAERGFATVIPWLWTWLWQLGCSSTRFSA